MTIDLGHLFQKLNDFEQIEVELEAEGRGVSINLVMSEIFREGLASDCMDEALQAWDSQWKSH